jgi:hypothetical protein
LRSISRTEEFFCSTGNLLRLGIVNYGDGAS